MIPKQHAIIYLRKSTDREDRQQISIETQRQYCEKLALEYNLETYTIEEHKSAKEEWKRPWFKQLLSLCKKWNFDYVIAYDPTRVSRNTIDSAYFTELINKWYIKWFYASESRQFFNWTDIFSALMLWISFLMSKADNQMRSSNIRKKMEVYFQQWKVMTKPPFWYKFKQFFDEYWKIKSDLIIIEKEAEIVKKSFEMRKRWKTLQEISDYFKENWYKKNNWWVDRILKNTFYIWIQKWKLWEAEIKMPWYKPIITYKLFEEVNNLYYKSKKAKKVEYEAYFQWLLFDERNIAIIPYETTNRHWKKYIYYRNQNNIKKLNISQNKLLTKVNNHMESYNFKKENITQLEKILKKEFNVNQQIKTEKIIIKEDLEKIEKERKVLAEKLISWVIDDDIYKEMIMSYMKKKKKLDERFNLLTDDNKNINTLIIKGVELFRNIYFIYKKSIPCEKSIVLKWLQVELFLRNDLWLIVQENELLKFVKNFLFYYGTPMENWTPVPALRRPCPNH